LILITGGSPHQNILPLFVLATSGTPELYVARLAMSRMYASQHQLSQVWTAKCSDVRAKTYDSSRLISVVLWLLQDSVLMAFNNILVLRLASQSLSA